MLTNINWQSLSFTIPPQVKFWSDYWPERISNLSRLKNSSPRLIINNILDEIEFNGFRNKKVKALFEQEINFWLNQKANLDADLYIKIQLLKKHFRDPHTNFINEICISILAILDNDVFFSFSHNRLKALLTDAIIDNKTYEYIETISDILIFEYINKGYSLTTCSKFPSNILSQFNRVESDRMIFSNYPHGFELDNYKIATDQYNYKKYNKDLINFINSLTLENRIDALASYFFKEKEIGKIILPLSGIVSDKTLTINNITIYSPESEKFLKNAFGDIETDYEYFDKKPPEIYSNALVEIEYIDINQAIDTAKEIIDNFLTILKFNNKNKIKLEIWESGHIVMNKDGILRSMQMTSSREVFKYQDSLRIDEFFEKRGFRIIKEYSDRLAGTKPIIYTDKQISASLHWYKKAVEEIKEEDKFINLWVALEKMFPEKNIPTDSSKIDTILDLVPYVFVNYKKLSVGWDAYHYTNALYHSSQNGQRLITLPIELAKKAQLDYELSPIILKNFVDAIPEILKHIDRKIVKDKLENAYAYFSDGKFASEELSKYLNQVESDLLIIYRYRNKIVHDGHYNDIFLKHYSNKLLEFIKLFLASMLSLIQNDEPDIYKLALKEKLKLLTTIEKLKTDKNFNLLD